MAATIAAPSASSAGTRGQPFGAAGLVIERVRALVEAGHREIVLTGVDLTSYGPTCRAARPWARWSSVS